jgi:NitT/TauT family transport system substrate-binding protein
MVRATFRGIEYAAQHPDEAFSISEKYVENLASLTPAEKDIQRKVLADSIQLWLVQLGGASDPQSWVNMQKLLLQMNLLTKEQDLSTAYSNEFLPVK